MISKNLFAAIKTWFIKGRKSDNKGGATNNASSPQNEAAAQNSIASDAVAVTMENNKNEAKVIYSYNSLLKFRKITNEKDRIYSFLLLKKMAVVL